MASLLHFEEKVHRKKLQRADTIPLLFSRLLCHILEYMGYPTEPHLECRHHCRERFILDKWTQLNELPTESVPPAPAAPMPEATYIAPFTTLTVPPDAPSTSEASITISTTEFRTMHLGLLPPPQPDIPGPSKPIAPVEETTRVDVPIQPTQEATIEASSPPEAPTT
ncbi:hypothetical protein CK203_036151 [Vitis vinifera]|uniref:Uncharacterized protein n=1 Tax=Vitis vinifera TaxID=29760 RepID=A0A438IWV2_VITVI|nr:hypothetical protein CK203_036151 [Vitis vinifera]